MSGFSKVRVLVAGDLMLDRFEYGRVSRISPEAPVPVFNFEREREMLGGVGNVAANLVALGCSVTLAGVVGRDASGASLRRMLASGHIRPLVTSSPRFKTIVKTRLIAGNNHLLRADQECRAGEIGLPAAVWPRIEKAVAQADVMLLSDYAKGFLSAATCRRLIACARRARCSVLVDPKGVEWEKYRGATLVKPNLKELALVCDRQFDPAARTFLAEVEATSRAICAKFGIRNLLVTLSEHGMILVPASRKLAAIHVPTEAREVFDVSGAGDTALAAFGAALGSGRPLAEALKVANVASGIVVSKLGTATVSAAELEAALGARGDGDALAAARGKIVPRAQIGALVRRLRARGKRIGFTNGCFDCCHLGHLHSLAAAKKLCDVLIVGVNSDASVRRRKGPSRPIQDEATRTLVLAALSFVDHVVVFDDDVPLDLVRKIRPDVIAKEGYPLSKWPEGRLVRKLGGRAVTLDRLEGYSTSALVARMNGRTGK